MIIASVIANIKYFFEHEIYFYLKRLTKKYYIIRRTELGAGFFSNYYWVMGHIAFARKLHYIPVVDMQNYPTLYSENEMVKGSLNAWNYYFEDVGKVSLDEAYKSNKYVLGEIRHLSKYADKYSDSKYRFPSSKAINYYHSLIEDSIIIRRDIKEEFDEYLLSNSISSDNTIGIHIRGTDMKNDLGHPMPAPTSKYIEKIYDIIRVDSQITNIYIATDEKSIIEDIEDEFKGKLNVIYQEAFRSEVQMDEKKTGIHEQVIDNPRKLHKYLLGQEVLLDAYVLSNCRSLVCGYSNITNTVLLWNNNKYKEVCHIG